MFLSKKILLFCIILFPATICGQSIEYRVKANFLEKFTRFVEWPVDSSFADTTKAFVLSVIGESPFNGLLKEIYSEIKIKNKKVEIRYINKISEINGTHLLFISKSEKDSLSKIISVIGNKPVLTVSETEGYAQIGVHINFYLSKESTISFEINNKVLKKSGLYMSHLLLRIAKIVD